MTKDMMKELKTLDFVDIVNLLISRLEPYNSRITSMIAGQVYELIEVIEQPELGEFEFVFEKMFQPEGKSPYCISVYPSKYVIERYVAQIPIFEIKKDHNYKIELV